MKIREKDLVLAKKCSYSMNCHETQLNNNVIIVGSSGCGKTRSIVSPNIRKAYGSYIISDPKGNLYEQHCDFLKRQGYKVKIIDFVHPNKSNHYNPFNYIRSVQDVKTVAHMLAFEAGENDSLDPFWRRSGELALIALIGYVWNMANYDEKNIETVYELLTAVEFRENDDEFRDAVDLLFDEYKAEFGEDTFFDAYKNFRSNCGRTGMCIKSEAVSRIGAFVCPELNALLQYDDINIGSIGEDKTAVFVIVSDTDRTMDSLANLFFTQAIHVLCRTADEGYDGSLPIHTRFIMDDFATNVKIGEFPRMISSFRSREISSMIIVQAESQLKSLYGYDAETIITNCDSYVYLGGSDVDTARNVATRCNKRLRQILYMPIGSVWVFRRGSKPVYTRQNAPFVEEIKEDFLENYELEMEDEEDEEDENYEYDSDQFFNENDEEE